MRTITAPGVEIKEIDKSGYSPAMVGTACYVMGFANKGEAYRPLEFTSRAAWTNYYGEPDNEAERYFYNACVEVLNQNGRLYCARLPYDNQSFEKIIGFTYTVGPTIAIENAVDGHNQDSGTYSYDMSLSSVDASIKKCAVINPGSSPRMFELDEINEYLTDEKKVGSDTFLIVDKTCGTYGKIQEDERKGKERELLGIMPVVTTALNGLYAQKLISVEDRFAKYYESCGKVFTQGNETDGIFAFNVADTLSSTSGKIGKKNDDLVIQLNSAYKDYYLRFDNLDKDAAMYTLGDIADRLNEVITDILNQDNGSLNDTLSKVTAQSVVSALVEDINSLYVLIGDKYNSITDKDTTDAKIIEKYFGGDGEEPDVPGTLAELTISEEEYSTTTVANVKSAVETLYQFVNTETGYHARDNDDALPSTVSFDANGYFPSISYLTDGDSEIGAFDRDNLKKIGVVVYKIYLDPGEGNKINFQPVEAFAGSLFKDDKDPTTGVTTFIDDIINSQSNYIYFFSNCFNKPARQKEYLGNDPENKIDILVYKPTSSSASMGFYEDQVKENISISKSIYDGMNKCFEKVTDINERDIDIVPDAGLANIASFIKAVYGDSGVGLYDLNGTFSDGSPLIAMWKADKLNPAVKTWKAVEQKLDTFCKKTRKDCMFIADGLRPMVIQGNKKMIRPSCPKNTIDVNILPYVKLMSGLNTSYGAGYMDWFEIADDYSGDLFWCPPSIKAMGCYINTDVNFNYWDAPAGLTRGIIAATDVAFSPTPAQAGAIYEKNWNYSINYPNDGIILEGQKTFQVKPTAFDRVNVRRLFLRLERAAYKVARYFVYEGNTAYTRQRLVDALDPYFRDAKIGGGIYDYMIRCNEQNNTPDVIDRNELKVQIGIKPVKTAEFILIDFIALTTGGSFEEAFG